MDIVNIPVNIPVNNADRVFREVKERVFDANMRLYKSGLVPLTFGNVSEKFEFE